MPTIAQPEPSHIVGGVDTHKHTHVAAALDHIGRVLAVEAFPATRAGYRDLLAWLRQHGELVAVGVEGCGSWGAGLARHLTAEGVTVIEVNRPNRQNRRRRGKSDPVDAEAAARAVLAGDATVTPKAGDGPVEAIRQLRVARAGAMKARTAAANQVHSLCDTAPEAVRAQLRPLTFKQKIAAAERWRPRPGHSVDANARRALASVARRWRALDDEARALQAHVAAILDELAPAPLARYGIGYETASQLLISAGDNPRRLAHETSFAALCGASPVEASSGKTTRHRLNRGGDRQANSALWTITRVRMVNHPPTKAYVERRTTDGLSKREIMRCLKRYIAREVFPDLQAIVTPLLDQAARPPTSCLTPRGASDPERLAGSSQGPTNNRWDLAVGRFAPPRRSLRRVGGGGNPPRSAPGPPARRAAPPPRRSCGTIRHTSWGWNRARC